MADELTCDVCGETFGSEEELQEHNQEEHAQEA